MSISNYKFGQIIINNENYSSDLIISQGQVVPNWWREEGHLLQLSDIEDMLRVKPEILIVGTGCYGVMKIDDTLRRYCKSNEIILADFPTGKAIGYYNNLKDKSKAVLAVHLTC